MNKLTDIPYEAKDAKQILITFEVNPDVGVVERQPYTLLDFFSDIGGLQGLIFSWAAVVISYFNYNYFDNFLVSKLFRVER